MTHPLRLAVSMLLPLMTLPFVSVGCRKAMDDTHPTRRSHTNTSIERSDGSALAEGDLTNLEIRIKEDPENEALRIKAIRMAARANLSAKVRHHGKELARNHPYSTAIAWTLPDLVSPDQALLLEIRDILVVFVEDREHSFRSMILSNLGVIEFYLATRSLDVDVGHTPRVDEALLQSAIARMEESVTTAPSPSVLHLLGVAYWFANQREQAIDAFQRAVDEAPRGMAGIVALRAAERAYDLDATEVAEKFATEALGLEMRCAHPDPAVVHNAQQLVGLAHLERNDLLGAEERLRLSSEKPERVLTGIESSVMAISTDLTLALLARGRTTSVQTYLDVVEQRWPQLADTWKELRAQMGEDKDGI